MKRLYTALLVMFAIPFVMGMGTGSGNITHRIPTPDKNFSATITDSEGVSTRVSQISFDGRAYLTASRGSSTVTIPFEKIASVRFGKAGENKKVSAAVTLKNGGTLDIMVDGSMPCYGVADFGNVKIEFRDIRKVDIHEVIPKEKP